MEHVGLLAVLRRHVLLVLGLGVIGLLVSLLVVSVLPKTYDAKATLFLRVQAASTSLYERSQFALQRVQSYPQLLDSPALLSSVVDSLGLNESTQELDQQLSADNPTNTVLLNVSATASTPDEAARIANAAADALSTNVNALENNETTSKNAVTLVPEITAQAPTAPSSPNRPVVIGLGLLAGLVIGALIALLLERFRPRVRTVDDVRRVTGLPVIAQLPRGRRLAAAAASTAALNLRTVARGHVPPLLLVAPAGPRAARGAAHLQLAWGFAQTGRKAVAVAGPGDSSRDLGVDLPPSAPGVSELLAGRRDAEQVTVAVPNRGFDLVPVGDLAVMPSAFELERSAQERLAPLVAVYDVSAVQAELGNGPLDLDLVGRMARSTLLVVSRRGTTEHDLRRLLAEVRALDIVPIGVLMTDVGAPSLDLIETWSDGDFLRVEFESGATMHSRSDRRDGVEVGSAAQDR